MLVSFQYCRSTDIKVKGDDTILSVFTWVSALSGLPHNHVKDVFLIDMKYVTGEKYQVNLCNRRLNTLFTTIVQRYNTGRKTNGLVKSSISSYFDPVFRMS